MTIAGKILFAHEDQPFGRDLTRILGEHGFEVAAAAADGSLLEAIAAGPRDLLLLETANGQAGLDLLTRIKADERFRDLPVVMLSSLSPEEGSTQALGLGAADFLTRPFRNAEILARIKAHLRAGRELNRARAEARSRSEVVAILREIATSLSAEEIYQILVRRVAQGLGLSRCSILLQGPDPGTGTVVAAFENPLIKDLPVQLDRYPEIRKALDTGEAVLCDAVDSDLLLAAAREDWRARGQQVETTSALAIPFTLRGGRAGVFYLRTDGHDVVLNTLDVQFADQVIIAATTAIERAQDLAEAMEGQRQLRELAETDPLTGLHNRRALEDRLAREMEQSSRYGTALSCLMIDVDSFKVTNDTYGHQVGDLILSELAAVLKRDLRTIDVIARFGGEEFCVLLPLTGSGGARILADRILRRVAGHTFGEPNHPVPVTVSIGIAIHPDDRVIDGSSLLRLADRNLLKAKEDGRNRYRD